MRQDFIISKVETPFPEPGFSALQRRVFAEVQQSSSLLAAALADEARKRGEGQGGPGSLLRGTTPVLRFGAYAGEDLVGWSYGWFEPPDGGFYMANSGVEAAYRRCGIYSALLEAIVDHARGAGAPFVRSRHSVLNNPVIVCKLRRGFYISGLGLTANLGMLVELVRHLTPERESLFRSRVIPFEGSDDT